MFTFFNTKNAYFSWKTSLTDLIWTNQKGKEKPESNK